MIWSVDDRDAQPVNFPEMRREVQFAVAALADEHYQQRVWVNGVLPREPYAYDFDMACHALLDDTEILDDPESLVGSILTDRAELAALADLAVRLRDLIDAAGKDADFGRARRSSYWQPVVESARKARDVFGAPDPWP
jgi:hypothetical protein